MNAETCRRVPTLSRARRIAGLLLASALIVAGLAAKALAEEPPHQVPIARVLDAKLDQKMRELPHARIPASAIEVAPVPQKARARIKLASKE